MTSQEPRTAAAYEEWVSRVAYALHEDCILEWRAMAAVHPDRPITMHTDSTHYGTAHDLVRRLGLAEAANGSALDPQALADALEAEGFVRGVAARYGKFNSVYWENSAAAILARLTSSPDPAALADRLVEEGRVSVWGRPGTKFTAKRAKAPEATDG